MKQQTKRGGDQRSADPSAEAATGRKAIVASEGPELDDGWLEQEQPRQVDWLWPGRIPRGMLSLICGVPEGGKSWVCADIAATVTTGRAWPDGAAAGAPGSVIMCSPEDDPQQTIRPRFDQQRGDPSKVRLIKGMKGGGALSIKDHIQVIERLVDRMPDLKLIVLDPLTSVMGNADLNDESAVRECMQPLLKVVVDRKLALVGTAHLNKSTVQTQHSLHRILGSQAFGALARAAWFVVRKEGEDSGVLTCSKMSISGKAKGLSMSLVEPHGLVWGETLTTSTSQAMLEAMPGGIVAPKQEAAARLLMDLLKSGPMKVADVEAAVIEHGFSGTRGSVSKAADRLGVVRRPPLAAGLPWMWELPAAGRA